ncbi:MAG: Wzy polymerase domain-containing protein, partial [Amphritea sp.]
MFNSSALRSPSTTQTLGLVLIGLLFLPASFYFQPNLGGEGMFIPFNSTVWIAATLVVSSAVLLMLKQGHITLPRYWLLLAALPAGIIISGFVVESFLPTEWLFRQLYILGGFCFLLALFQFRFTPKDLDKLIIIFLLASLAHATYGISQIIWPGIYPAWIVPSNGTPYGIFQQINLQASLQATALLTAFFLISKPLCLRPMPGLSLLLLLTIFTSSFIVAYSGSRVGLLSALIGLLLLLIGRWKLLLGNKTLLVAAILLISLSGYLGKEGALRATGKFQDLSILDESVATLGAGSRKNIYSIAFSLLKEAPVFGHGIGSFQKQWHDKKVDFITSHPEASLPPQRLSHPHNELMFWMVEGGLISISGIVITALTVLVAIFRCGWKRGVSYLALLLPVTLHTQVELPFYISNIHWFLLLSLLFLILQHDKVTKKINLSRAATISIASSAVILFAVTTFFMVHSIKANAGIVRFLESRMSQPRHLEAGLANPYFNEMAELQLMRTLLLRDLQARQNNFAPEFINWATAYLEYRPISQIYVDLARAHLAIGERDKALAVIAKGTAIYPTNKGISEAVMLINNSVKK